jgi:hypothetical protein
VRQGDVHPIDDYLSDEWIDAWTREVIGDVELYLAGNAEQADADPRGELGLDQA